VRSALHQLSLSLFSIWHSVSDAYPDTCNQSGAD
jgi:hypothetical protein